MRVALVHDYLNQYGGAERVLDEFHAMFPDAPVYVSIHEPASMPERYQSWDIRTTWLDRVPLVKKKHQQFLPLFPLAFESMDLRGYDLVLSSASGFCHGVLTEPDTCHVCYCHSPPRFLWDSANYLDREGVGTLGRAVLARMLSRLRMWDRATADRVDAYISTSRLVQNRIQKFYRLPSVIIPPPTNVANFHVDDAPEDYFLIVMRLVGWKRPDIAVEACTRLGLPLVVAGDGRDLDRLKAMAGPTVRFFGRANDAQLKQLYAKCRAFILPSEEDFGITPLEAMASGRPVIAYGAGGVLDTVIPGRTGEFFAEQTADSLAAVLKRFDARRYDSSVIRAHAEGYDSTVFRRRMHEEIARALAEHRRVVPPLRGSGAINH
jgi:glycosyltransferase involved in cell wall biosynthesis